MNRKISKLIIKLVVLNVYLFAFSAQAIDGDVVYSAPYIMVDPDTGQIVTVNPGPKLKAHEIMVTNEDNGASTVETSVSANINNTTNISQASEPNTTLPIIVMIACLFMVVTGFVIWKKKQGKT
ncbi:MAG: hypothetical protein ACI9XC_001435 [Gammaproteobacteria bacterium]|jgi:hypothetical protein